MICQYSTILEVQYVNNKGFLAACIFILDVLAHFEGSWATFDRICLTIVYLAIECYFSCRTKYPLLLLYMVTVLRHQTPTVTKFSFRSFPVFPDFTNFLFPLFALVNQSGQIMKYVRKEMGKHRYWKRF